jgi:anti-sigma regulatory factor (Ser/Thr protein kinase)
MSPRKSRIRPIIDDLLAEWGSIANRNVVATTGATRQAVHAQLQRMVRDGELVRQGAGRSVRYRGVHPRRRFRYQLDGLDEDRVWREVRNEVPELDDLPEAAERALHTAVVELVDNAVAHSRGKRVEVSFRKAHDRLIVEVFDDGEGIFDHLAHENELDDSLEALRQLTKGRLTTLPREHTGEGLFLLSKIADFFEVESGGLLWMVDNEIDDVGIASAHVRPGTRVRFEVDVGTDTSLESVFAQSSEAFELSRRRVVVKLFESGNRFLSRSEARKLLAGLGRFRNVVVDFRGVDAVGQGFVDEMFRVWPSRHHDTRLHPVNMVPPIAFLVEHGRKAAEADRAGGHTAPEEQPR